MQINWDELPPEAQWVAQERSGSWYWFKTKPFLYERPTDLILIWVAPPTLGVPFIIGTTFNVDYQNTLQQRPANSHDVLRKKNIDIPRYDMGIQYIKTSASEGYGAPAIIESEDGEYVKLDDYIELLNAFNQYVSRTHKEIA